MNAVSPSRFGDEITAALDWWREAGVDCDFAETPTQWLAEASDGTAAAKSRPARPPQPVLPPPRPVGPAPVMAETIGGARDGWPQDLTAFADWWMAEPTLDVGGVGPRIAPRGVRGAKLMVLVAEPEVQDSDRLLSGPQGALLSSMFRAMGLEEDSETRVAALLPRHVPMADWAQLGAAGLGEIALHHAALAAPERILVLGRNILPLLGHDMTQGAAALREINHVGGSVAAMCAHGLDNLLAFPQRRKGLWHRWLEWTG